MKKIISMALALMLVAGMVFMLASCGGNGISNGTYVVAGDDDVEGVTIEIKDNKMIMKYEQEVMNYNISASITFTYVINGDKITATYESCDVEGVDVPQSIMDMIKSGMESSFEESQESSFEKTENGFKIDDVEYVKQ